MDTEDHNIVVIRRYSANIYINIAVLEHDVRRGEYDTKFIPNYFHSPEEFRIAKEFYFSDEFQAVLLLLQ
jgi:hypothetical protein